MCWFYLAFGFYMSGRTELLQAGGSLASSSVGRRLHAWFHLLFLLTLGICYSLTSRSLTVPREWSWSDWITLYMTEKVSLGIDDSHPSRAWLDHHSQHPSTAQISPLALLPTIAVQKCKQFSPKGNRVAVVKVFRKSDCVWPVSQAGWASCSVVWPRLNGFRVGLISLAFQLLFRQSYNLRALFPLNLNFLISKTAFRKALQG